MLRLGYPCQNLTLPASTTHTLRLANVPDVEKLGAVVEQNLSHLESILRWNAENGIEVFRIGSHLVPFASHPAFPYGWPVVHGPRLREIGRLARELNQRLSFHPGQYINPGSRDAHTAERSIAELTYVAQALQLLGARDGLIVLHLGGGYGEKREALQRFVQSFRGRRSILQYLALENDERVWTVREVHEACVELGVPLIFDAFHHRLNPGGMTPGDAFVLAMSTWRGRRPKVHISSQEPAKHAGAHAGYIRPSDWRALVNVIGDADVDVMIEAKEKERALMRLRDLSIIRDGNLA